MATYGYVWLQEQCLAIRYTNVHVAGLTLSHACSDDDGEHRDPDIGDLLESMVIRITVSECVQPAGPGSQRCVLAFRSAYAILATR